MNEFDLAAQQFGILDHAPAGMCVVRQDYLVLFWNRCLEDWTGLRREELLGKEIGAAFPSLGKAQYRLRLESIFNGGPPTIFSSQLHGNLFPSKLPTGKYRTQHTTVTSVPALNGVGHYALFAVEDVTEMAERIKDYRNMRDQAVKEIKQRQKTEEILKQAKAESEEVNRQLAESIDRANLLASQAKEASEAKSMFLANMSHELRTPLNSVNVLSQLLIENKERTLSEKQIEYAKTINQAGKDLLSLINDVLDLSKVEAGKREFLIEQIEVDELIGSLARAQGVLAEKKGLSFVVNLSDNVPASFLSDLKSVQQILRNLISNAIKFTGKGEIILSAYVLNADDKSPLLGIKPQDVLCFSVADSGIGIANDRLESIFSAFEQENSTTGRDYGGTGLGLSISRNLANFLGGELSAQSEKGKGSKFLLYLPMKLEARPSIVDYPGKESSERETGKHDFRDKESSRKVSWHQCIIPSDEHLQGMDEMDLEQFMGMKILLVDDDMRTVFAVMSVLEENGFEVVVATNGEEAVRVLSTDNDIVLVVMDIMMPEMDGIETMKKVRNTPSLENLPIVAMTAKAMKGDREECLRAGASEYLAKPVESDVLLSTIRNWIKRTTESGSESTVS